MSNTNELITKCVLDNVMFEGTLGAQQYTVQDLVHAVSARTINNMWKKTKKELSALDTDSLFENPSTIKKSKLQLKVDTLEIVFKHKQEKAKELKEAEKARKDAESKLAALKQIKTEKELESLGKMTLDDINKEIANIEGD